MLTSVLLCSATRKLTIKNGLDFGEKQRIQVLDPLSITHLEWKCTITPSNSAGFVALLKRLVNLSQLSFIQPEDVVTSTTPIYLPPITDLISAPLWCPRRLKRLSFQNDLGGSFFGLYAVIAKLNPDLEVLELVDVHIPEELDRKSIFGLIPESLKLLHITVGPVNPWLFDCVLPRRLTTFSIVTNRAAPTREQWSAWATQKFISELSWHDKSPGVAKRSFLDSFGLSGAWPVLRRIEIEWSEPTPREADANALLSALSSLPNSKLEAFYFGGTFTAWKPLRSLQQLSMAYNDAESLGEIAKEYFPALTRLYLRDTKWTRVEQDFIFGSGGPVIYEGNERLSPTHLTELKLKNLGLLSDHQLRFHGGVPISERHPPPPEKEASPPLSPQGGSPPPPPTKPSGRTDEPDPKWEYQSERLRISVGAAGKRTVNELPLWYHMRKTPQLFNTDIKRAAKHKEDSGEMRPLDYAMCYSALKSDDLKLAVKSAQISYWNLDQNSERRSVSPDLEPRDKRRIWEGYPIHALIPESPRYSGKSGVVTQVTAEDYTGALKTISLGIKKGDEPHIRSILKRSGMPDSIVDELSNDGALAYAGYLMNTERSRTQRGRFEHELLALNALRRLNGFPQLLNWGVLNPPTEAYIVMSIIPGRTLSDLFENKTGRWLSEPFQTWLGIRLYNLLVLMESKGVLHGDLHANNIIVDLEQMSVVVIDFGMSVTNLEELMKVTIDPASVDREDRHEPGVPFVPFVPLNQLKPYEIQCRFLARELSKLGAEIASHRLITQYFKKTPVSIEKARDDLHILIKSLFVTEFVLGQTSAEKNYIAFSSSD